MTYSIFNAPLHWHRGAALLAAAIVGLVGCATTGMGQHFRMTPVAEDDFIIEVSKFGPMLVSTKANMAISIQPVNSLWASDERPGFHLYLANLSDYGFKFGTENIRALYNGEHLRVASPEASVVEARRKQQAVGVRTMITGFLARYSGHMFPLRNIEDTAAYMRAQQQAYANAMLAEDAVQQEIIASRETALAEQDYRRNILREQVIPASGGDEGDNVGGGVIFVDIPSSMAQRGRFEILIDVEGEFHDFHFSIQRVDI